MEMKPHAPNKTAKTLQKLAEDLGLPYSDLSDVETDPSLFDILPVEAALNLCVLPLAREGAALRIAVSDPLNLRLEARLATLTGGPVLLSVAPVDAIRAGLKRSDSSRRMLDNVSSAYKAQIVSENADGAERVVDLDTLQDQTGIVQLANSILMVALQRQASDIHVEVFGDRVDLRYRIDGVLYPATDSLGGSHHAELVSRYKVMANLDIAERRLPQDGRFRLRVDGREVDFRVSILPTQFGEDVVIRVLDKASFARFGGKMQLDDLGLEADDIVRLRRSVREPHGLVLITGPTGSGKTTTLYGAMSELANGDEKLITVEDPIEYQLDRIVQVAVNHKKGVTFAKGLRAILRHDPDRIMIGEIRDLETAEIAVQAALTGHLVLASVHANSAFDVVSRFTHWGIDLHDLVTATNAVFAQRLLRKICPECRRSAERPKDESAGDWAEGKGCEHCFQSGYAGRVAIMEHLSISTTIAELILARAPASQLMETALSEGMSSLRQRALKLARRGVTTREEVDRVTFAD
jgi:type IV pilus assembly protein PilB